MNFFLLILSFFLLLKLLIELFINFLFLQFFIWIFENKIDEKRKEKLGKLIEIWQIEIYEGNIIWGHQYRKNHLFHLILSHLTSFFTVKRKFFPQKENLCKKLNKKTQKTLVLFFLIFYGNFHFSQECFTMKDNLFIRWKSIFLKFNKWAFFW